MLKLGGFLLVSDSLMLLIGIGSPKALAKVLLGPRCLKIEHKALSFLPICRLRSHSTVMGDAVRKLKK